MPLSGPLHSGSMVNSFGLLPNCGLSRNVNAVVAFGDFGELIGVVRFRTSAEAIE